MTHSISRLLEKIRLNHYTSINSDNIHLVQFQYVNLTRYHLKSSTLCIYTLLKKRVNEQLNELLEDKNYILFMDVLFQHFKSGKGLSNCENVVYTYSMEKVIFKSFCISYLLEQSVFRYIIYTHIQTHTHTHTYIYIHI